MSDATDLKQRFALVNLRLGKHAAIEKLLEQRKPAAALKLCAEMGLPVSRGVVIDLHSRRQP